MKCVICKKEIEKKHTKDGTLYWDRGNNAQPVVNGRCCDECNSSKVIPARISKIREKSK